MFPCLYIHKIYFAIKLDNSLIHIFLHKTCKYIEYLKNKSIHILGKDDKNTKDKRERIINEINNVIDHKMKTDVKRYKRGS